VGIVVDLTPGIKVQPVRWILKKIGKLLNADTAEQIGELQKKMDNLEKALEEHKIESIRFEILDFANSCMNGRKHTKEEFDHVIKAHDDYMQHVNKHKLENGQMKMAYAYIEKIYARRMEKNDFLTGKENDE